MVAREPAPEARMDYQTLIVTEEAGVGIITLNRPSLMNALNAQMRAEILHAVRDLGARMRVLVLTGAGRAFCSGQDLGGGLPVDQLDLERILREEYEPMLRAIGECPLPVIAAVNGAAAGAGANLALAADVVIAARSAVFVQAFTRIGLIPDAGGTYWLPRQVGFARAMGLALFAEKITAEEAVAAGMIWEAVEDERFDAHWRARAAHLAQGPGVAYRALKQALRASFANDFDRQLALEAQLQGDCGRSRDFVEGVMAFLEKRPARFDGR
jgi:2-(1,2-epoxy-1,2-dihydrophenyl)acetyl-CoA isomerase